MFFVLGGALLWWGALGDLVVWGVLAGGGSYVLEGCSSGLGPAVLQRRPLRAGRFSFCLSARNSAVTGGWLLLL